MKVVRMASIGLVALSIITPAANAQQKQFTVMLVQKLQPVVRSYPGVAADILGIRTGMTVAQAEAVAEKSYPGKPKEDKAPYVFTFKEITIQSQPFVQRVDFKNEQTADMSDTLSLYFNGPVIGNTLYAMTRKIEYNPSKALNSPLASTIKESLIKKYGPASFKIGNISNNLEIIWAFTQKSQTICKDLNCVGTGAANASLGDLGSYTGDKKDFVLQCTNAQTAIGPPDTFGIEAITSSNSDDTTKINSIDVMMRDAATCMDDYAETVKQLKAAAIKFYKTVSKAPAPPKM